MLGACTRVRWEARASPNALARTSGGPIGISHRRQHQGADGPLGARLAPSRLIYQHATQERERAIADALDDLVGQTATAPWAGRAAAPCHFAGDSWHVDGTAADPACLREPDLAC